jgi:hypothetical protein
MRGSLGEKIGEGASADIHAWAPGQVVKLFKSDVELHSAAYQARMTRAVFAAGVPVPEVLGEVTLKGRFGIVLSHLEGPTLLQLARTGAIKPEEAGAILATLYMSVHRTPPPEGAISLPYLPVLRALAVAEQVTNPARRERLIQHVEAALRSADRGGELATTL